MSFVREEIFTTRTLIRRIGGSELLLDRADVLVDQAELAAQEKRFDHEAALLFAALTLVLHELKRIAMR